MSILWFNCPLYHICRRNFIYSSSSPLFHPITMRYPFTLLFRRHLHIINILFYHLYFIFILFEIFHIYWPQSTLHLNFFFFSSLPLFPSLMHESPSPLFPLNKHTSPPHSFVATSCKLSILLRSCVVFNVYSFFHHFTCSNCLLLIH